ncbi:MAG: hypothetical protein JWQ96_1568 [Segetibacter sp.]|jgi:hypothetical protein|nr:hypothetical protein [Segetibacter sp.]
MNKQQPSLPLCIIMDVIGYASFALPVLGEFTDVVWAPISAMIFYKTFGGAKGAFGAIFNFAEEILPFSDFIPTFTIMWVWQYFTKQQGVNTIGNKLLEVKKAA